MLLTPTNQFSTGDSIMEFPDPDSLTPEVCVSLITFGLCDLQLLQFYSVLLQRLCFLRASVCFILKELK